jgi:transcriptional regulator with XRE-family HTH domain
LIPQHDLAGEGDRMFGARLMQERLLAGTDPEKLASRLDVTADCLDDYETGRVRIGPTKLVAAATALGVPLSLLCYQEEKATHVVDAESGRTRWLAIPRPPNVLSTPSFRQVHSLLKMWSRTHGAWTNEIPRALTAGGVLHRTSVLRQMPQGSRLVFEYCAPGLAFLRPCESLTMVGREFVEGPDREFGARTIEGYMEAASRQRPLVQSVRALIRTSAGETLRARYDRVLLPWRYRSTDLLVMGVTLRRENPVAI